LRPFGQGERAIGEPVPGWRTGCIEAPLLDYRGVVISPQIAVVVTGYRLECAQPRWQDDDGSILDKPQQTSTDADEQAPAG
jgi:hypothetical protein